MTESSGKPEKTYIYALSDPNTGEIRYVGKSDTPKSRLKSHMQMPNHDCNLPKKEWLRSLVACNQLPMLSILEEVPYSEWEEKEKWWIDYGYKMGWRLTNLIHGGVFDNYKLSNRDLFEKLKPFVSPSYHDRVQSMDIENLTSLFIETGVRLLPVLRGAFAGKMDKHFRIEGIIDDLLDRASCEQWQPT